MLLKIENLHKRYGGVQALESIDISVEKGTTLGLAGGNGAGKSTLMKCITGLETPDSGDIFLNGEKMNGRTPHEVRHAGVEMIYQDLALCPQLDVVTNIFLGREKRLRAGPWQTPLLNDRAMRKTARDLFDRLKITIDLDRTVGTLSGGQRQSVAMARALLTVPRLLIMDEPTAALGVQETNTVLSLIETLKQQGIAVILISHRIDDFFKLADRIAVMRHGKIVADVPATDFTPESLTRQMLSA